MPCGCSVPAMPTAEGLSQSIESAKQKAYDALDSVKDSFNELEEKLKDGIDIDPVKDKMNELTGKLKTMADDPASAIGGGCMSCIAGCLFPLAELGAVLKDAAQMASEAASVLLNGVIDRIIGLINIMIEGFKGIGAALMTTMSALSEVGTIITSIGSAFAGDAAAKLACAEEIELFVDKADFKLTSSMMDKIFGSLGKLAKSPDLDAVIKCVTSVAQFLADAPAKIKNCITPNACVSVCISVPPEIGNVLDKMDSFGKMFNADALTKALTFAKKNAGARQPSTRLRGSCACTDLTFLCESPAGFVRLTARMPAFCAFRLLRCSLGLSACRRQRIRVLGAAREHGQAAYIGGDVAQAHGKVGMRSWPGCATPPVKAEKPLADR